MLLLECKPDELLARKLGYHRRTCLHQSDKGRVCKRLQQTAGNTALIDEDPRSAQPPYLSTLELLQDEHGFFVLVDRWREHRIIIVRPRLEEWLITTANSSGIPMERYGLSDRGNELHREINSRLAAVARLLDALLEQKAPRLIALQNALQAL